MSFLANIWEVALAAARPVLVLSIGAIFPLFLLSYIWTNSGKGVLDIMSIANAQSQFYHMQILVVPLCITAVVEGMFLAFSIDRDFPKRAFAVFVVVAPVAILIMVMSRMLLHAMGHVSETHNVLKAEVLNEGINLIFCCVAVMLLGEIGNALIRARSKALRTSGVQTSSSQRKARPKTAARNSQPARTKEEHVASEGGGE
jgi:hypothetical protein